jgi:hypothetical protein
MSDLQSDGHNGINGATGSGLEVDELTINRLVAIREINPNPLVNYLLQCVNFL